MAYDKVLPHAQQVADPFHVIRLANDRLSGVRYRVQNETLGHRGRKDDPLYRTRRLLTKAHERISTRDETRLLGLLNTGDPHGEVRLAWHAKETVRGLYQTYPFYVEFLVSAIDSRPQWVAVGNP